MKVWLQRLTQRRRSARLRWAEDLDFLGSKSPAAWWAWVLLALGALAIITLSLERQNLQGEMERADARLRQAQRFEHQAGMRAKLAQAQAAESQQQAQIKMAVNEQTLRAASKLVRQLAYPWAEVLNGVELASGEVALLGLRHDAQSGEVHLDAAVRDDLMALKWVDALSADRDHFEQAWLQSREPLQQPVGELTTRVQLVAVLSPRIEHGVLAVPAASAASAAKPDKPTKAVKAAKAVNGTQHATLATPFTAMPTLPSTRIAHVEAGGRP